MIQRYCDRWSEGADVSIITSVGRHGHTEIERRNVSDFAFWDC